MVVFDTSLICIAFDEQVAVPWDPATSQPISDCKARINLLIQELSDRKTQIFLPTPVLAEYLVKAGKEKSARLQTLKSSKVFSVKPFDEKSAIECAMLEDADLKRGKKLDDTQTKAKVRFDRQIISIAKVHGATTIYTGDSNLAQCARDNKLNAVLTWELPPPPAEAQLKLGW
jgi:predicted nucleic acid-binding protein